jgi:hypothetical protein
MPFETIPVPSHSHNQGKFGEFRGLKKEAVKTHPSAGAMTGVTNMRNEHGQEQQDGNGVKSAGYFFEAPIIRGSD